MRNGSRESFVCDSLVIDSISRRSNVANAKTKVWCKI